MRWVLGWANSQHSLSAWVVAGFISLLAFPNCHHLGVLSRTALTSSPNVAGSRSGASCPALTPAGPAHLLSHQQGHVYCFAQVRCTAHSLDCCTCGGAGLVLPFSCPQNGSPACSKWQGRRVRAYFREGMGTAFLFSCLQVQLN